MKHKPLVSEKAILRTLSAAGLLWEGGDFTGYFEQMERAARMDPRNFQIPMNLGISRLKLYQYPQAEASFERSVLLAPDKSRALEMIGLHCPTVHATLSDDLISFPPSLAVICRSP